MAVQLGSNISALTAQRRLGEATGELSRVFQRLSSGQRINRASDDAAGLAISDTLNLSSRVYNQGVRNLNDGISALSIADGALGQLSEITQRQLELANQAANGSLSYRQRQSLDRESFLLSREYDRIIGSTKFNGMNILTYGSNNSLRVQMGFGTDGSINFNRNQDLSSVIGTGTSGSQTSISSGSIATSISVDWNGDGYADIISGGGTGGSSYVFQSLGNGNFSTVASLGDYTPLLAIDVNSSGTKGFIARNNGNNHLVTFILNGQGGYSTVDSGTISGSTIKGGDFNGDGTQDFAISNGGASTTIYTGNGSGLYSSFASLSTTLSGVGDVNGDGLTDVVTKASGTSFIVYTSRGNGTFDASASFNSGSTMAGGIAVADFNHDGKADIFAVNTTHYDVLLSNGDGTFSVQVSTATTNMGASCVLTAGDFFGNGQTSVMAYNGGVVFRLFSGNSDGTFTMQSSQTWTPFYNSVPSMFVGDFSGDGVLDFGLTDYLSTGESEVDIRIANSTRSTSPKYVSLVTVADARNAITTLQSQLNRIGLERGAIGGTLSRYQAALNATQAMSDNYTEARSRIVSSDIASDSAHATRLSILQQTATAVLAQANQSPALALQLLSG